MTRPRIGGRLSVAALIVALLSGGVALAAGPGPTPTPRPKLSGGFGKPRTSPPPGSPAGASEPAREGASRPERAAVTINNQTLVTDPQKGKISTSNAPPATPSPGPASRTSAAEVPVGGPSPEGAAAPAALEEAKWRAAAKSARERVQEGKGEVERLTSEAAKLESDFYAWDDGQYRDNVIKPAWDKKKQELEATKAELAAAEIDLADLPEKARKAGALPGWLRE